MLKGEQKNTLEESFVVIVSTNAELAAHNSPSVKVDFFARKKFEIIIITGVTVHESSGSVSLEI
jgi:hypothetical protein